MFKTDVIGLGMAVVDVAFSIDRMPTWDDPRVVRDFSMANGGPAATACIVASKMGIHTGFVGTFGIGDIAERKLHVLREAGVDISHIIRRDTPENRVVIHFIPTGSGEKFSSPTLSAERLLDIKPQELDRDYITSGQYLHLDSFEHLEAALQAARWMHKAGKTVVFDAATTHEPIPERLQAIVAETDVLICGSGFGPMLTGQEDIWEAGRAVLNIGPRIVVQTEGIKGNYTVTKDEEFHIPAFKVHVVDTCGAGDVFHGAYLTGLVKGWDLRRIATFSSAVSAIHSTVLGNQRGLPTLEEAEIFVQNHKSS